MTRPPAAPPSRRGVLGGVLVALAAAGCVAEPSREDPPEAVTTPGEAAGEAPEADPDAQLVRRVVDDLTAALALVGGVARARPALATDVAPWRELHAAHLGALEEPGRAGPLRVRGPEAALRARVRRQESSLQRRLAASSVAAESGPLAALLATMSAAVAQQLAADATRGDR